MEPTSGGQGWELEETKETWPIFQQHMCILEFKARKNEPEFTMPQTDISLSDFKLERNLERQGLTTKKR